MDKLLFSYLYIEQITLLAADKPLRQAVPAYQLLLVLEGKGELTINDDKYMLETGSLYFINRDRFIEIHSLAHTDVYLYRLSFDIVRHHHTQQYNNTNASYSGYHDVWLPDGELYAASHLPFGSLMQQLCALTEEQADMRRELEQQRCLYEILQHIVQHNTGGRQAALSASAEHRQHIQYVISYMQQNYAEDITRDSMARLAGFHPRSFTKIFKEETGENFIDYLTNIRIKKAKELILLSKLNLDAIAQQVGYSNGLYLSRKFKQHTGSSPTQYVKQLKRIVVYDLVGNVVALGLTPVGASYFHNLAGLLLMQEKLEGVVDVGRQSTDTVVELEPELIIVPKWLEPKTVTALQKIAPTLIVPYGNPFERFRQLAELLERRQEAAEFAARYQQRAQQISEELGSVIAPHETVGLYELSEHHIWVLNEFHGRGGYNLYRGLGLTPPLNVQKHVIGKGQVIRINLEQLPDYAADHMIISYNFTDEGQALAARLLSHPVWQSIAAYHHQRIYTIDRRIFHASDVYSLYKQLELQRSLFLGEKPPAPQ